MSPTIRTEFAWLETSNVPKDKTYVVIDGLMVIATGFLVADAAKVEFIAKLLVLCTSSHLVLSCWIKRRERLINALAMSVSSNGGAKWWMTFGVFSDDFSD